jgi:hypothetical protein
MSKRFIPTRNSRIENERGFVHGGEILPQPQYWRWDAVTAMKLHVEI